jgi:hypothetical protein
MGNGGEGNTGDGPAGQPAGSSRVRELRNLPNQAIHMYKGYLSFPHGRTGDTGRG